MNISANKLTNFGAGRSNDADLILQMRKAAVVALEKNFNIRPERAFATALGGPAFTEDMINQLMMHAFLCGKRIGDDAGYGRGHRVGHTAGHKAGYSRGLTKGKIVGFEAGYAEGESVAYDEGYNAGYDDGYTVESVLMNTK